MYKLARSALFCMSAETAHEFALEAISRAERLGLTRLMAPTIASKPRTVMGLTFDNPIGLAAGLDKDGDCLDGFGSFRVDGLGRVSRR